MWRQQEETKKAAGFKETFAVAREQEIWIGLRAVGGATGPMLPAVAGWYPSSSRACSYDVRWNLRIDPVSWSHCLDSCVQACGC